jgi:hypothetical protein
LYAQPPFAASSDTNAHADLKRELISQQTKYEIGELNTPTALQRFGAPFRSDAGEVAPENSELPLLRYIFVHHVRNFPFLDKAKEKEFWQDKLQIVSCAECPHSMVAMLTRDQTVPRVVCEQRHFVVRRPIGRNEAKETSPEGA